MDAPLVAILLGTYNGSRFLPDLIDSIKSQSHDNWMLLARDDGSSDDTAAVLDAAAAADPRIHLLSDDAGNLGTIGNFGLLLASSETPYLMFADQDDVWLPTKIAHSLHALRSVELVAGPGTPAVVFTDLAVTDEHLHPLHPSFIDMHAFRAAINSHLPLRGLITQNVAPGCSMIFNAALRRAALPIPEGAAMHDWWLMLVAAVTGHIEFLPEATICYRQHGGNQLGAVTSTARAQEFAVAGFGPFLRRLSKAQQQAGELAKRFSPRLSDQDLSACRVFSQLRTYPPLVRQYMAMRHRLIKSGLLRNLAFYALM